MYRILSLIVIAGFVSIMLYFHQQSSHFSNDAHAGHKGQHDGLEISSNSGVNIPKIDGWVKQDEMGNWMLKIDTKNFSFTPEKLGSDEQRINEGHAHLYINGEKKNRIYGQYYDLGALEPGGYKVKVTLNTNNHKVLMYNGKEIAYHYDFKVK